MSIENNYMAKIAMDKSILKEYRTSSDPRVVYLNNGDEFQIQLFNKETFTVGVEISVNGESSNGLIVLRPGERFWLERPLNVKRKYKFETYEVEDSEEVENAIKNNGEIRVRFYKETYKATPVTYCYYEYVGSYDYPNFINNSVQTLKTTTCYDSEISSSKSTKLDTFANDTIQMYSSTAKTCVQQEDTTIETGRVSTGSSSNQRFDTINKEFETLAYNTEIIKLLPMSRKPYTSSDLTKTYCTECGRKINPKFKFCPYCGTKCLFYDGRF